MINYTPLTTITMKISTLSLTMTRRHTTQIVKFLTSGQEKRMDTMLANLEKDTGFRVRVLCQAYPNTPGLAVRDYWSVGKEDQKDDKYVILVVDEFGGKEMCSTSTSGRG